MKRKWLTALSFALAVLLLGGAAGVLAVKGDWRYCIGQALAVHPRPRPERIEAEEDWQAWTLEALLQDPRASVDHSLLLVSAASPLPEGWEPSLSELAGWPLQADAAQAYLLLQAYVLEETDTAIRITSSYRSPEEQLAEYEKRGEEIAARPGESEHETGLSLDVCVTGFGSMSFLKTRAGRLVNDECERFGFIIRYPHGGEDTTGFSYEPWHLRYVGAPHAEFIMRHGLTLEDYLELLTLGDCYLIGDALVVQFDASAEIRLPAEFASCRLSMTAEGRWACTVTRGGVD